MQYIFIYTRNLNTDTFFFLFFFLRKIVRIIKYSSWSHTQSRILFIYFLFFFFWSGSAPFSPFSQLLYERPRAVSYIITIIFCNMCSCDKWILRLFHWKISVEINSICYCYYNLLLNRWKHNDYYCKALLDFHLFTLLF